jgi:hypothetical protein
MAFERWGTFSVRDHLDVNALVANVLLYDRLVIPVPSGMEGVRKWWAENWGPDLLNQRLEKLGELAVKKPWDAARQARCQNAMQLAREIGSDAGDIVEETTRELPYQLTRRVLAQEQQVNLPPGVTRVDVVAAFNSVEGLNAQFRIEGRDDQAALALLLRHEIAVPAKEKGENALDEAIALSSDRDFRDKRRDFYEWQDKLLEDHVDPRTIAKELAELVQGYNRCVEKAVRKVDRKFAFMLGGIAVSLAGAIAAMNPLPVVGALITFVSFKLLDGKPAIDAGRNRPAAMFHDSKKLIAQERDETK